MQPLTREKRSQHLQKMVQEIPKKVLEADKKSIYLHPLFDRATFLTGCEKIHNFFKNIWRLRKEYLSLHPLSQKASS